MASSCPTCGGDTMPIVPPLAEHVDPYAPRRTWCPTCGDTGVVPGGPGEWPEGVDDREVEVVVYDALRRMGAYRGSESDAATDARSVARDLGAPVRRGFSLHASSCPRSVPDPSLPAYVRCTCRAVPGRVPPQPRRENPLPRTGVPSLRRYRIAYRDENGNVGVGHAYGASRLEAEVAFLKREEAGGRKLWCTGSRLATDEAAPARSEQAVRRDHYLVQVVRLSHSPDPDRPFYARCACGAEFREAAAVLASQRWGEHVVATITAAGG